uniref:Uncharacterized protein n=1 Tax=Picea sitchensis TaxID=3332 RepID=D5ABW5_PICSI|nr:unknown [Picea sitchensis]
MHWDTDSFCHIEHFGRLVAGERKVEGMEQGGEHELNHADPHVHAGTDPPACAKRDKLEIGPSHVHAVAHKPVGVELQRFLPQIRVALHTPRVHEETGVPR